MIRGSALKALESGDPEIPSGVPRSAYDLMTALDTYIPIPKREVDKPF